MYGTLANMNTIRVVLAACAAYDYVMEQLDADTAFLYSKLVELVYTNAPFGVKNTNCMVCKLEKANYGSKQAASAWNKTIRNVFLKSSFKSFGADQCVHVKSTRNGFVHVCLYVDDMIIAAKTSDEIREVKETLKNASKMKESGVGKFIFLGMEIDHDKNAGTLMIKQTREWDAEATPLHGHLNRSVGDFSE
uniref:Putative polyprotein n=1 Tax=Albugo laibachii Nc14 TaxID=890382 RepID=F0WI61_9STRA|nr:putative polyprotein [Albugo laibachii Nc14]|eukprot:CCA20939.1 putative polyprotein [Albugo laibachii Nc14]